MKRRRGPVQQAAIAGVARKLRHHVMVLRHLLDEREQIAMSSQIVACELQRELSVEGLWRGLWNQHIAVAEALGRQPPAKTTADRVAPCRASAPDADAKNLARRKSLRLAF